MTTATALDYLVRPFVAEDYVKLHALCRRPLVADPWLVGRAYELAGPAFTGVSPDFVLLGCAGLQQQWTGRAIAWAVLHPVLVHNRRAAIWFHREVKRRLPLLMAEHGLRRVDAEAVTEHARANKWLHRLGFKFQDLALHYGPQGETFSRYARFAPGLEDLDG